MSPKVPKIEDIANSRFYTQSVLKGIGYLLKAFPRDLGIKLVLYGKIAKTSYRTILRVIIKIKISPNLCDIASLY
jgi:hypothetical protein